MGSLDTSTMAKDILAGVGGDENVASVGHCATRLRFKLKNNDAADKAAVEQIPGVITVVKAGGQFQVVIGNKVPDVYRAITPLVADSKLGEGEGGEKGNLLNRFIALISSIFLPILWPLAGAGLFKAFVNMAIQFGWLDPESGTGIILNAASDSVVYFLPLFLAITSAKRFGANQFTSLAVAGALVYPTIVALNETGADVTFLGIPVVMMSYVSSVIPIIIAVWVQSHFERLLDRVLPDALRNFMTPLLVLLLLVPFVLMTVGPITTLAADGITAGVTTLFAFAPWLGGAIMGGFWQVFVLFGLHWGLVPVMINDLATQGYSILTGPILPAVLAQVAAATAVWMRTRSAKRRGVAGPGVVSGFAAGITEPIIYGVNLPLKTPFY
ncbi:MAG: PTS transporter subunit EIIC, partial [Mobilicoccus sp.]|nr:PTS transporter subunit EIIC [Mobilicoccus sp.]